jgi:D-galacturonate reductase
VVALVFAHLQSRGKIGHIALAGTSGHKMPAIRQHLQDTLAQLYKLDLQHIQTFPHDDVDRDTLAYINAMDSLAPGDLVSIFTPDDTHFDITMAAIQRGLHVILTKPPVKTLREHQIIAQAAKKRKLFFL